MTRRTAALAAMIAVALAAPAGAAGAAGPEEAWSVSTASGNGAFRVDATCAFGLVLPGRPNSFQYTGVATAPGAVATTVTCHGADAATRTVAGPVSAVAGRQLWELSELCVSASATFPTGVTVTAPLSCVTP